MSINNDSFDCNDSKYKVGLTNFIPISRDLFDHALWHKEKSKPWFMAWQYLISEARFQKSKVIDKGVIVHVKRGQLYNSLRFYAKAFGWSTKQVTSFLNYLESDGMIKKETVKETGQTLITLCNYDVYNGSDSVHETLKKHQRNTKETPKKRRGNAEETKSNNYNKDNNVLHTNVCNNSTEKLLTYVDEDWKELLTIWLDFKKSKGQTYKNENSVKILFNKLKRESDNDLEIAALMIEQSIANNWAGIFKIKDNGNKQSNRQYETTSERTEFARKIAEGIERGYKSREGNTNKQI